MIDYTKSFNFMLMESLDNLFKNHQSISPLKTNVQRLKTYINKKYGFNPEISLATDKLIIYAPTSSQTAVLRLDLSNLNQLIAFHYPLQIRLKRQSKLANDQLR
ncbi:MAG: hypothetical protein OXF49_02750 [Candidatus Saccharibacteria bacterium]|nr:hypothetical protein [Candidatus Saccharibacteria bacterium]